MNNIRFKSIGIIHSPFKEPRGAPIQPSGAKGIEGISAMKKADLIAALSK